MMCLATVFSFSIRHITVRHKTGILFSISFFFHYEVVSTELFHRRECVLVNRGVKGGEQNFEFCYVAPSSVGFGKKGVIRGKKTVKFPKYDHKGRYIPLPPPRFSQISKSNEPFMNARTRTTTPRCSEIYKLGRNHGNQSIITNITEVLFQ